MEMSTSPVPGCFALHQMAFTHPQRVVSAVANAYPDATASQALTAAEATKAA